MDLRPYISRLQHELAVAAEAGGDDARQLAERLTAPLESATRLVLLEALSTAAGEISLELDSGSIDVRLRGLDPEFVVAGGAAGPPPARSETPAETPPESDDDKATARFSLRLPERLKPRLEQAATQSGVSVNAWLVRTVSAALDVPAGGSPSPDSWSTGQSRSGWVR